MTAPAWVRRLTGAEKRDERIRKLRERADESAVTVPYVTVIDEDGPRGTLFEGRLIAPPSVGDHIEGDWLGTYEVTGRIWDPSRPFDDRVHLIIAATYREAEHGTEVAR